MAEWKRGIRQTINGVAEVEEATFSRFEFWKATNTAEMNERERCIEIVRNYERQFRCQKDICGWNEYRDGIIAALRAPVKRDTNMCTWCHRPGANELVNRKRWYHTTCIELLDMLG